MSELIRILQVGMSPNYGGTEAFVMEQYRHIDRDLVQFDFLNVFSQPISCAEEIEALGGRVFHLDMARHNGLKAYFANLDTFFKMHQDYFDGIHCNCQSLINIDLLKYAKKYGVPLRIVHAHNAGFGQEPGLLQRTIILVNKFSIKRFATHFFACSTLAAQWMFPRTVKTTVIHNAIDVRKFGYSGSLRTKKRKDLKISVDTKVVFFAGRLDPQKNPLFLIDIFEEVVRRNENSLLLVAGDGYMKEEMISRISEKALKDKVRLLGNRTDVHELMQAADVFLLPSHFEGLGIVLVEAQASGLPCFTSKDAVPVDVNLTNSVHFISLSEPPIVWADNILRKAFDGQKRQDRSSIIAGSGYSSEDAVYELQAVYLHEKYRKWNRGTL